MPNGIKDEDLPWSRSATSKLDMKYLYVCHAVPNAILNKNLSDLKSCTLYVKLFPCSDCAKLVIQSGIKKVLYVLDKHPDMDIYIAARTLFSKANIECKKYASKRKIEIDLDL